MRQTKAMSLFESIVNVLIGFVVAFVAQLLVFPLFDINVSVNSNLQIAMIFTFISIIRSYIVRRMFNGK